LWATDTGECLRTLVGHDASVTAVGLASRAWKAISGSSDQSVKIWDLRDGLPIAQLWGHTDTVTAVTIDREATHAASASVDRTIKIWRVDGPRPASVSDVRTGAVLSVVFSTDGRLCASGSDDGRIIVRDVDSWRTVREISTQSGAVRSLAFSSDNSCVLSSGDDLGHWLWTIDTGEGAWIPVRHSAPVDCYALSAVTRYLITSCSDRFVYLWDVPSGALVDRYGTRRLFDHLIAPSPKRQAVSGQEDWQDRYLSGEAVYSVVLLRMSQDGAFAVLSATRQEPGAIRDQLRPPEMRGRDTRAGACLLVVKVRTGEIWSVEVSQSEPVTAFTVADEGGRLLLARVDHALELWNLEDEQRIRVLQGHTDKVNRVLFCCGGTRAVSSGRDRTIRVWDLDAGVQIAGFTVDAAVRALGVTMDPMLIAAGDSSGRTHLLKLTAPSMAVGVKP
jgi:WD40 repeat protein